MWIHRVSSRQPFLVAPTTVATWRAGGPHGGALGIAKYHWRTTVHYCVVWLLLLPSHVLFTGSSSETWSNGGSRYRINNGSKNMHTLIAQVMLWDFCCVFSSSAGPAAV